MPTLSDRHRNYNILLIVQESSTWPILEFFIPATLILSSHILCVQPSWWGPGLLQIGPQRKTSERQQDPESQAASS